MSNHDLIEWCQYFNILINNVLSRDQIVPHNHKLGLLNLHMWIGCHWAATYVKDNTINYFDSFGMPPFQELVNHAEKKNLTLPHQNNQIQDLYTTKCGYFCLYFLNEMSKGTEYLFDFNNTKHNRKFISKYFNIV